MMPQALRDKDLKQQIEDIQFNRCDDVQFEGKMEYSDLRNLCHALRQNTSLERIFFSRAELGKRGLLYICEALQNHPSLSVLSFSNTLCSNLYASVGKLIQSNINITDLTFIYCELDNNSLEQLIHAVEHSNLNQLMIRQFNVNQSIILDAAIRFILINKLKLLGLPLRYIDVDDGNRIADALYHNSSLKMLMFDEENSFIEPGAIKPILEKIYRNTRLSIVKLRFGWLRGDENFNALIHFLSVYTSLHFINITNQLTNEQLQQALEMMRKNNTLIGFGYDEQPPPGEDYETADDLRSALNDEGRKNRTYGPCPLFHRP